jgi:hypothetical protein
MAVLGVGGRVLLKRPCPAPCDVYGEQIINIGSDRCPEYTLTDGFYPGCNAFDVNCPGWQNGDHISVEGLPIFSPSGQPYNPDGYGSYAGSKYWLGPNRDHIRNNSDKFYKTAAECYDDSKCGDAAYFYAREGTGDVPSGDSSGDYWVHIDEFGRVRFYQSRCLAISGCPSKTVDLAPIWLDEDGITLYPYGESDYQNAHWDCIYDECMVGGDYANSDVQDHHTDVSICEDAPEFAKPVASIKEYLNADVLPRPYYTCNDGKVLCDLREYSLTLDAPAVDTTIVGEKFGEAVKSLVNGGGSFEFFVDRACNDDNAESASWEIFNLLFLTEGGGTQAPIAAEAWFYLMSGDGCAPCFPPAAGSLYYKADILITQTAVNVRPTVMIVGTAQFVTTGEIKLLQAP